MTAHTDDEIDLFAQTIHAGFVADRPPGAAEAAWENMTPRTKGDFRRAARALVRHLYHGQPINKAPHHMSVEETALVEACDEYEAHRRGSDYHGARAADFWAERIAEHFALIRRAVHRTPGIGKDIGKDVRECPK